MLGALDLALLRALRTRGHTPALEAAAIGLARVGEHAALWHAAAVAGSLLDRDGRPRYLHTIRAVGVTQFVTSVIKLGLRRARPAIEDLPALMPTVSALSYPSAHASTAFAAARGLGGGPALYALAVVMALSRPYLGVHYPSDTLAGAVLGDALARLTP
ncbi:MAG: phosphatase PAP2 family protein [Actinomycetota bacterium]|nr:phosphatase PAP2 family protein [Actinomycetota bacterium]